ncbi:MAG: transposase [Verrucomicrobiaceae bacterium]|nr:transposase [Verrucomicrobiaceae bacterium]
MAAELDTMEPGNIGAERGDIGGGGDTGSGAQDPLIGVKALTGVYVGINRKSWARKRIRGDDGRSNVYHVMSRTCGGEIFLDETEREALVLVMRKMARFCGIKILTYCIMGNHFHALVRVPHRGTWLEERFGPPGAAVGEEKLFEHMRLLYSKAHIAAVKADFAKLRTMGGGMELLVQERVTAMKERMCDVSAWMQEVKVRFSRWYNRRHERQGTLWMGKFKSVLVERKFYTGTKSNEREPDVARVMAAYIDLNPVRAKLVEGAEDWRWNGWSAALAGDKEAIAGLCDVLHCTLKEWAAWGKRVYAEMVSERRSDIERLAAKACESDVGARRTLLMKIPEFSRSLVIGEFEDQAAGGGGNDGRTRRSRMVQVQGLTVRMVAGSARQSPR